MSGQALCACKDRALSACPGEWEPGCDLGNNPAHARVHAPVRYVLHPGYVTSASDGQEHFIGGPRLAELYRVNIRDRGAVVFGDMPDFREQPGDVHLRPRADGDYRLPGGAAAAAAPAWLLPLHEAVLVANTHRVRAEVVQDVAHAVHHGQAAEIERLRGLLHELALAADDVDGDGAAFDRLHTAMQAAMVALGA